MPDWQGELESLLATLNVSLEVPTAGSDVQQDAGAQVSATFSADAEHARQWDHLAPSDPPSETSDTTEPMLEVVPVDGEEISAVRSEIEATLREVLTMAQAGRMDRALRDDVVFVLEALTRPRPGRQPTMRKLAGPDDSSTEWNLASAAAVLRFCRIVLRLTSTLARDDEH